MILVLLGTQDSPFPRLLQQTEEAIYTLKLRETIFAQVGMTPYQSNLMKVKDYFLGEEYEQLLKDARIIICHGGAGIIFKAMNLGKKVIAMPRLAKYGEHNDDHQIELVQKLAELKFIYKADHDLTKAIIAMNSFNPKRWKHNDNLLEAVSDFIDRGEK